MATSSDETCFEVLDPFEVLIGQISQELTSSDVKVIKTVISERVNLNELEKIDDNKASGTDLISILRRKLLLSRNNWGLLKDLLKVINHFSLLSRVKDCEKTLKILWNAPVEQIKMIRREGTFVELYLVVSCKKENLSIGKIDELKHAIEEGVLKPALNNYYKHDRDQHANYIFYQYSSENESDANTTVVIFQFPKDKKELIITEMLQKCALDKDSWLTDNGVVQLKVNGKSSINLKESLEFKTKFVEDEVYLARKPEFQPPTKNMVDVILAVEMSHSVTAHGCKKVINMCHLAIEDISATNEFNINLSIIQYGNQTASTSDHVCVLQDFCKEFDVKSQLKEIGQCGAEGGNSGIADALAKVGELAKHGARSNASKLCILITFPSKTKKGLKHYSSHSGNDVFKITHSLAECEIPVYIFGASDKKATSSDPKSLSMEEVFLSGVAHIGGGRYFRISDENGTSANSTLPGDVLRHNVSIENQEETLGEVVKDAINNHFGDTNENILAKDVVKDQRFKQSMFVQLLQNGRALEPINHVAKRIALADDLDDAIAALERMERKEKEARDGNTRGTSVMPHIQEYIFHSGQCATPMHKESMPKYHRESKVDVEKLSQELQEKVVSDESYHSSDFEMATRIVRRHLYRLAYYKKKH